MRLRCITNEAGSTFAARALRIVIEERHARAIPLAVEQRGNPMKAVSFTPDGCYTPGRGWLAAEQKR